MRPLLGTWPAAQACALTGNWTSNLLLHRPVLNPLSYTSQDPGVSFLKILFICLRGREGEGEKHWCVRETLIDCPLHAPNWGLGLQPRHVSWLRTELATFQFASWHSIHWATPARTGVSLLIFELMIAKRCDSQCAVWADYIHSIISWNVLLNNVCETLQNWNLSFLYLNIDIFKLAKNLDFIVLALKHF